MNRNLITVFEHQSIKLDQTIGGVKFDKSILLAMQKYYGDKGVPYFSLINNGIKFNEYVGVIQVGTTIIEVLPKADNIEKTEQDWRGMLIDMLHAVGTFNIHSTSNSILKIKTNSILDLYFELFIYEIEYLLHNGLIKQYRKKEENTTALKGKLVFSKHIQQNLTHQERFYVSHTTYDFEHKLHFIIYKTILLLKQINTNMALQSRIGALLLYFPEMHDITVSEEMFDKIVFNRKNQCYKNAVDIARLLLLKYHPDIKMGRNNILALMFDMNKLWEKFVYISLCKYKNKTMTISQQISKSFWQPEKGYKSKIRPDIIIKYNGNECFVIDTKWKNLNGYNPSPDDLRQMYVYHDYYHAYKTALVYPGVNNKISGYYFNPDTGGKSDKECCVISIPVEGSINEWQKRIAKLTLEKLDNSKTI